jgi:Esterase/lipase
MGRRVVVRALLTSTAFVILGMPALVLAGAFLPDVSAIARFGALLDVGLAWVLIGVLTATSLTGLAVALGGRRFTLALLAVSLVVTAGAGVVAYRYASFARDHGAAYDVGRSLVEPPANLLADASFTYPTTDPKVQLQAELWRAAAGAPNRGPNGRAAVVYVHGGGFVGGGLHMRPNLFAALAAAGYPVLDVEYRLAPPPRWADAPGDVLCGLAFLRTIAAVEDIDPARVDRKSVV